MENFTTEKWAVSGVMPGYEISSTGRVRRITPDGAARVRKVQRHNHGYNSVASRVNGTVRSFLVHRLVAEAFLPRQPGRTCVNHKNGVKTDNRVENLEWCDYVENNRHASRAGLLPVRPVVQLDIDGNVLQVFRSIKDAAEATGANPHNITACCRGYKIRAGYFQKSAGGFKWRESARGGIEQIDKKTGDLIACFRTCAEAGRATGISYKNIYACVRGYTAKSPRTVRVAAGFKWRYAKKGENPYARS